MGATLRVQDSLQSGRSRFYAEVLRVRQLLDLAKQSPPSCSFSMNCSRAPTRRIAASGLRRSLRILIDSGAIGLVTTHDLALTDIADRFGSRSPPTSTSRTVTKRVR